MSRILTIDPELCQGHGRCYARLPELLTEDEAGFVAERGHDLAVPAELADVAQASVDSCPEGAIELRDGAGAR